MEVLKGIDVIQRKCEDLRLARKMLGHPYTVIDYVTLCDPVTLEDVETVEAETLLALAVKVGKTRLIDNCLVGEASDKLDILAQKG
jgi:pantothenate synthetase